MQYAPCTLPRRAVHVFRIRSLNSLNQWKSHYNISSKWENVRQASIKKYILRCRKKNFTGFSNAMAHQLISYHSMEHFDTPKQ